MIKLGRKPLRWLIIAYIFCLVLVCFLPQSQFSFGETPGILWLGRLVVLLRPLNTLWALGDIQTFPQLLWIIIQNLLNVFLLYPLVLGLLFLDTTFRSMAAAVKLAFTLSLTIEVTQLFLSLAFDANRVFEIDDLWTNTLGGYLAWKTYQYLKRKILIV